VGLERGPLILVSTTVELLDRKVAAPVKKIANTAVEIRYADHVAPSIRKSWQSLRRQAAVSRSVYFASGLRPWSNERRLKLNWVQIRSHAISRSIKGLMGIHRKRHAFLIQY
jgi:hypothetical protein